MQANDRGEALGLVTNIQRYTIHDGPGIRTEIFFKGCSLRCLWCSNPETISPVPEIGMYASRCVGCRSCFAACPLGGGPLRFGADGPVSIERDACPPACRICADQCPSHAIMVWGKYMTASELLDCVLADMNFYLRSGGGVTLSGGEVLLQWEFAAELLRLCKENDIHTCVESALNVPTGHMEAVLKYTDLLICDIKTMDRDKHISFCGGPNELVLKNVIRASEIGVPLVVRTPVIPDFNDSRESIAAIGAFIRDRLHGRVTQYQLLPYRKMGTEKLASLNRPYPMGDDYTPPPREVWENNLTFLAKMLREEYGINAFAGSAEGIE